MIQAKVYIVTKGGKQLQQFSHKIARPTAGQVAVKIRALAHCANFATSDNNLSTMGSSARHFAMREFSGSICAVGSQQDKNMLGREVMGVARFADFVSHLVLPAHNLSFVSTQLDIKRAAAVPKDYSIASQLIGCTKRNFKTGNTKIFIHHIDSEIGLAALDLATIIGAKISGSALKQHHNSLAKHNLEALLTPLDFKRHILKRAVEDAAKFDLIINPQNTAFCRSSLQALKPNGKLTLCNFRAQAQTKKHKYGNIYSALTAPLLHPYLLANNNYTLTGVDTSRLIFDNVAQIEQFLGVDCWSKIAPSIDSECALENISHAFKRQQKAGKLGKIIIKMPS